MWYIQIQEWETIETLNKDDDDDDDEMLIS